MDRTTTVDAEAAGAAPSSLAEDSEAASAVAAASVAVSAGEAAAAAGQAHASKEDLRAGILSLSAIMTTFAKNYRTTAI